MSKHWRDVKDAIEKEIDKTWWDEPVEVTMSKKGVFPSGAGTNDQYIGNLFFLVSDTQAMGWGFGAPTMQQVLKDDSFSLEQCKTLWKYMYTLEAHLMGGSEGTGSHCPSPWLNLPKFSEFGNDIIDSFDSIKTKDDFRILFWSWQNYINTINRWFQIVFPWEFGGQMKINTAERIAKLKEYQRVFDK